MSGDPLTRKHVFKPQFKEMEDEMDQIKSPLIDLRKVHIGADLKTWMPLTLNPLNNRVLRALELQDNIFQTSPIKCKVHYSQR